MVDDQDTVSRRSVLRSSAVAAGALAVGGAGTAAGQLTTGSSAGASNKRGGRAQAEGDVRRNDPFTLSSTPTGVTRGASCMSGQSAEQGYLEYDVQYCDSDDDESDATLYVVPDEAELFQDGTYVIRSVQQCRAAEDVVRVAFGPAPHGCP